MISDNRGGRGRKVPYDTMTVRVPMPLVNLISGLSMTYMAYRLSELGEGKSDEEIIHAIKVDMCKGRIEEILAIAVNILAKKKSARLTVKNLLQVLYGCKLDDNLNLIGAVKEENL